MSIMRRTFLLRLIPALLGLGLAALALLYPLEETDTVTVHGGSKGVAALEEGMVLDMPFDAANPLKEVSVVLSGVKEAQSLTMTLTLLRDGQTVESQDTSLAGVKARERMTLALQDALPAGAYALRVTVRGEGRVTLTGVEKPGALMNGEEQPYAVSLRLISTKRRYGASAIYMGLLLVLLSLVPAGKKGAAGHA